MAKEKKSRKPKNPHAVGLGKLGGAARTQKLTPEQRREIARKAANARWARIHRADRIPS
jgi:hypothetical protein